MSVICGHVSRVTNQKCGLARTIYHVKIRSRIPVPFYTVTALTIRIKHHYYYYYTVPWCLLYADSIALPVAAELRVGGRRAKSSVSIVGQTIFVSAGVRHHNSFLHFDAV